VKAVAPYAKNVPAAVIAVQNVQMALSWTPCQKVTSQSVTFAVRAVSIAQTQHFALSVKRDSFIWVSAILHVPMEHSLKI
jgi:hypothetical protein